MKRHFTLIELAVVMVAIALSAGVMFLAELAETGFAVANVRHKAQLIRCQNNLKQIAINVTMFIGDEKQAPLCAATNADRADADGKITAANLLQTNKKGLVGNENLFACPLNSREPLKLTKDDFAALTDGSPYTDYNLTTAFSPDDFPNKIIIADSPAADHIDYSIHDDAPATKTNWTGPNCLYFDGHVKNEKTLCPQGSAEWEFVGDRGNLYQRNAPDNGAELDTFIQHTGAGMMRRSDWLSSWFGGETAAENKMSTTGAAGKRRDKRELF